LTVRPAEPAERAAVDAIHEQEWGGPYVVAHDVRYDLRTLPTLIALDDGGNVLGALVWHRESDAVEVVSLAATAPGRGVGTALLDSAVVTARRLGARRLWLITTNDNLPALRFYQRRGLRLVAVDSGAVDRARRRKPSIPLVGHDGIGLHDELILELRLRSGPTGDAEER